MLLMLFVNRCRRYSYVNMSSLSSCQASDGFTEYGDRTQLYRDTEILEGLRRDDMAHLNRRQVRHNGAHKNVLIHSQLLADRGT